MAKLIRCSSGHVYDSEAHTACPECERMGLSDAPKPEAPSVDSGGSGGAPSGLPTGLIAIGAAGALVLAGLGYFLLKPSASDTADAPNPKPAAAASAGDGKNDAKSASTDKRGEGTAETSKSAETAASTPQKASDPNSDADYAACKKGDIAACGRAIASNAFSGQPLGALYRYRGFAKSHAAKPDLDGAIADYGESVRLEPDSFVPYILRANAYDDNGDQERAIKDYDKAIELNPRADFYNNRGNALRKVGDVDKAIADLDRSIKLDPGYYGAYWNRGLAYRDKGDKAAAAEDFRKALTLKPSGNAQKQIEALLKEVAPSPSGAPAPSDPAKTPDQGTKDEEKKSSNDASPSGAESGKTDAAGPAPPAESGNDKTADTAPSVADSASSKPPEATAPDAAPAPSGSDGDKGKSADASPPGPGSGGKQSQGSSDSDESDWASGLADALKPPANSGDSVPSDATKKPTPGGRPGGKISKPGEAPLPPVPGGVATAPLPGVYLLSGVNDAGDTYVGMVALVRDGKTFRLTAYNGENVFRGSGQFADGVLKLKYTDGVTALLKLNDDGSFDGKWTKGKLAGSERLQPYAFAAPENVTLAEGEYRLVGKSSEDHTPTSGTATISKRGTGYHVAWSYDDNVKYDGWGTLSQNILTFRGPNNAGWEKDAAIIYALGPDGTLTGLFASGFGEERLTPVPWSPAPTSTDDTDKTPPDDNADTKRADNTSASDETSSSDAGGSPKPADNEAGGMTSTTDAELTTAAKDPDFKTCYLVEGDKTKVLEICDRAIKSGNFKGAVLGELYVNKGLLSKDVDQAFDAYNTAIGLDPKSTLAFVGRGRIYAIKGKPDLALTDLDTAVGLAPKRVATYVVRAEVKAQNKDVDAAMKDYDKAFEIDPKSAEAYESRGHVLERQGNRDAAMKDYVKASEFDPKRDSAFLAIGNLDLTAKKYDDALKDYGTVIALRPDWAFGYISRAKVYLAMVDAEHAQADLDKASTLDTEGKYKPLIKGMQTRLNFAKE